MAYLTFFCRPPCQPPCRPSYRPPCPPPCRPSYPNFYKSLFLWHIWPFFAKNFRKIHGKNPNFYRKFVLHASLTWIGHWGGWLNAEVPVGCCGPLPLAPSGCISGQSSSEDNGSTRLMRTRSFLRTDPDLHILESLVPAELSAAVLSPDWRNHNHASRVIEHLL